MRNILFYAGAVSIIVIQLLMCMHQIDSYWQWGHNGYNGAAYLQAARNSLRWGIVWPSQYHTSDTKPSPDEYYTHAPLGLHWLTTLSVAAFGETELSVRLVPSLFSILAAIMLLILLAKHYSRGMALLATFIYVLLPINSIYCNMANHPTGCIFFALLMFDGYLEWTRRNKHIYLIEAAAGFIGATFFDWPGYTMAVCLGIAALYEGLKPSPDKGCVWRKELLFSVSIFILVAVLFKGFFTWVSKVRGLGDLLFAISGRSETSNIIQSIMEVYGSAVKYMFPKIVMYPAMAWLLAAFIMHAAGKFKRVDVVPVSFFVAGLGQYFVFPNAAVIHYYWIWYFNPFVAIGCAQVILWVAMGIEEIERFVVARWVKISIKILAWAIPMTVFFCCYTPVACKKFNAARAVAGSLYIPNYTRDYKKIMFARIVNKWTSPHDGVAIHSSISHRIEVDATLDRQWSDVNDGHLKDLPQLLDSKRKWVLIGDMDKIDRNLLVRFVKKYPFTQIGSYFFVDFRRHGKALSVYSFKPLKASFWWKFFVTPYDPPLELVRQTALESKLQQTFMKLKEQAGKQAPAAAVPALKAPKIDKEIGNPKFNQKLPHPPAGN